MVYIKNHIAATSSDIDKTKKVPLRKRKENNKTPVDPLSMEEVLMLRRYFFNNTDYFKTMPTNRRNYLYTVLSLNLMRRCGDMVKLRVCDVLNEDGTFKKHVIFNHE